MAAQKRRVVGQKVRTQKRSPSGRASFGESSGRLKYSLTFMARPSRIKGLVLIEASVTHNSQRERFSIRRPGESVQDFTLLREQWDTKRGAVRGEGIHSPVRKRIDEIADLTEAFFRSHAEANLPVILEELRRMFLGEIDPSEMDRGFLVVIDRFVEQRRIVDENNRERAMKPNTVATYKTLRRNLEAFQEYRSRNSGRALPIKITEFEAVKLPKSSAEPQVMHDIRWYLTGEKNYRPSSIAKTMKCLATVLRWAQGKGYSQARTLYTDTRSCRFTPGNGLSLTPNEVKALAEMDLVVGSRLWHVRNMFLLAVYTGQRYSDLHRIDPKKWQELSQTIKQVKTGTVVVIPHKDEVRSVLREYETAGMPSIVQPSPSGRMTKSAKFNLILKKVARVCGLDRKIKTSVWNHGKEETEIVPLYEVLSSHDGRRTFVSTNFNSGSMTLAQLKVITGHRSDFMLRSGGSYLKIQEEEFAESIGVKKYISGHEVDAKRQ